MSKRTRNLIIGAAVLLSWSWLGMMTCIATDAGRTWWQRSETQIGKLIQLPPVLTRPLSWPHGNDNPPDVLPASTSGLPDSGGE